LLVGQGGSLVRQGALLVGPQLDRGLRPVLGEVTKGLDVELRFEDVSKVDFSKALSGDSWSLVANLPYNVGTPVVMDALRNAPAIDRFIVMMQREVAVRLAAGVGSQDYGLPSVIAGIYSEASVAFTVPPQVFYPPPRVESAVAVLLRKPTPEHAERAVELARAGFGQRRKMLRRSLSGRVAPEAFAAAGVAPEARPEQLGIVEGGALTAAGAAHPTQP